ncbi:MAG: hypothetical protein ABIT07_04145 [Ferruginibacter sp.]
MKILWGLLLAAFFYSCTQKKIVESKDNGQEKMMLIDADKAFSNLSEARGMKQAFLEFMDSNGVLLRPKHTPIIGANAIEYLIQLNDSSYTLTWQPQHAIVAKSADIGYTYGLYALHPKVKDTVIYGTYVSIWKKQQDGKWKFVLDTGNEGIEE